MGTIETRRGEVKRTISEMRAAIERVADALALVERIRVNICGENGELVEGWDWADTVPPERLMDKLDWANDELLALHRSASLELAMATAKEPR